MINKEEYKRNLIRMFDSVRTEHKGEYSCNGVLCINCQLEHIDGCGYATDIVDNIDVYNTVEVWSKEHPPKKHKISQLEYDILKIYAERGFHGHFAEYGLLMALLKKGYFKYADGKMDIEYYFKNCEVADDD